jgi:hypothetical protein
MLRAKNWGRWLALARIVIHVAMSALHMLGELAVHSLLCALVAYFLFHRIATRYFRFHIGRRRSLVPERPSSADAGGFGRSKWSPRTLASFVSHSIFEGSLGTERQSPLSGSGPASLDRLMVFARPPAA